MAGIASFQEWITSSSNSETGGDNIAEDENDEQEYVKIPWALDATERIARLEAQLKAMELRLVKIDYGINHHKHDKVTESPVFDCI